MRYYIKEIKPYIEPPCLQGFNSKPAPIEGYDWAPEDTMETIIRELYNKNLLNDPMSKLTFQERYVQIYDDTIAKSKSSDSGIVSLLNPVADIHIINPKPDDVVVATFSCNDINLENANNTMKYLQNEFPNNKVIGLLDNFTLELQGCDWISEYIENIKKHLLEGILNDK